MITHPNIYSAFFSNVWALDSQSFEKYGAMIERVTTGSKADIESWRGNNQLNTPKIFTYSRKKLGFEEMEYNSKVNPFMVKQQVLYIPIHGLMLKNTYEFSQWSGIQSTEYIAHLVRESQENENILGFVFDYQTGGGDADGILTLMDAMIASEKPIVSLVNGYSYSAGSFSMTPSDWIYASEKNAEVGSLGVIYPHHSYLEYHLRAGIKTTLITSDGADDKKIYSTEEDLSADKIAKIEARLNTTYDYCIEKVLEARPNIDPQAFENAATYAAPQAIEWGVIDEIVEGGIDPKEAAVMKVYELAGESPEVSSSLPGLSIKKKRKQTNTMNDNTQVTELEAQNAKLGAEVQSLTASLQKATSTNDTLKKENASLLEKNEALKAQNEDGVNLSSRLEEANNNLGLKQGEVEERDVEIQNLNNQVLFLKGERVLWQGLASVRCGEDADKDLEIKENIVVPKFQKQFKIEQSEGGQFVTRNIVNGELTGMNANEHIAKYAYQTGYTIKLQGGNGLDAVSSDIEASKEKQWTWEKHATNCREQGIVLNSAEFHKLAEERGLTSVD